ncbi:MAG: energy transducer TonB [Candidatus Angelobacter sp.]
MTSKAVLALLLALLTHGAFGEDKPTPQTLLDAAHKMADLSTLGPYILTGTLVVNPGTKKELTGSLAVYRDRDRARVDVQISGRNETRITIGNKDYVDPDRILFSGWWLNEPDRLWDPKRPGKGVRHSQDKWENVSRHKIGDTTAWCMEKGHDPDKQRLCVDAVRDVVLTSGSDQFSDYMQSGRVMFPQKIRITGHYEAPIEIRDIKISPYAVESALFEIPSKTMELESCENGEQLQAVDATLPPRTETALTTTSARIALYAFIDKQGQVAALKMLGLIQPSYDAEVINAVKKWRFKPATCNGQPVNTAMIIEVAGRSF